MSHPPKQRFTRSSSNSSNITPQDIKVLIDKSNNELLNNITNTLEREVDKLNQTITSLLSRVQKLEESNKSLASKSELLEEKCNRIEPLKNDIIKMRSEREEHLDAIIHEVQGVTKRKNNITISGLREANRGTLDERVKHDLERCQAIFNEMKIDTKIVSAHRLGKAQEHSKRLLKVELTKESDKWKILSKAKCLKNTQFKEVFINPDYTLLQQRRMKVAKQELKERREQGEDVVLHRGDVVLRSTLKNFR